MVATPQLDNSIKFEAQGVGKLKFFDNDMKLVVCANNLRHLSGFHKWNSATEFFDLRNGSKIHQIKSEYWPNVFDLDATGRFAYIDGYGWPRQLHVYDTQKNYETLADFKLNRETYQGGAFGCWMFPNKKEIVIVRADGAVHRWD